MITRGLRRTSITVVVCCWMVCYSASAVTAQNPCTGIGFARGTVASDGGFEREVFITANVECGVTKHITVRGLIGAMELDTRISGKGNEVGIVYATGNALYHIPKFPLLYLTGGAGVYWKGFNGPTIEGKDGPVAGANAGAGVVIPVGDELGFFLEVEFLYHLLAQDQPDSLRTASLGFKVVW